MTSPLDRHRFWVLGALLALALAGHLHWLPLPYSAWLCGLLGLAAWRARHGVRPVSIWVRVPLLITTVGLLTHLAGSPLGREGGSALLGGLLVLKLFESRQRRDLRVMIAATLFFCMIGFLFDQGLLLTLYFCAVAALCFVALDLASRDPPRTTHELFADLGRGSRLVARVMLASIPATAVAFVFVPRLSAPLWGAPWETAQGRTGVSDRMRPGALSRLWNDDSPAFRVTFAGAAPPIASRYWRGPVLWFFDGEEWTRADLYLGTTPAAIEVDPDTIVEYEILTEPTERSWWFPLDIPVSAPDDTQFTGDGQVRARQPLLGPRSGRFRSAWRYRFDADSNSTQRWMGLQLPDHGNPRARALAAAWRARHGDDPRAIIDEALALFHREFTYTLEPPPLARDAIDDFLFATKAGYCEHFASSFVFLMRAAGIPARVVTGYQGGSYNAAGGYWIVRNSDAHAWSEVWLDGQGWVRVDPTAAVAPERIDRGSLAAAIPEAARWFSRGWGLAWRDRLDLIARFWRKAVIEFDAIRQRNALRSIGLEDAGWKALGGGLLVFGTLAIALGVWLSLRGQESTDRDPLLLAYRRFVARLGRAGVIRNRCEGPIAFGERAALALPRCASTIVDLTRRFAELRYGDLGSADLAQQRRLARELRAFRPRC